MKKINFNNQTITPSKVVCIGRNFVEHIEELGNEIPEDMVIFNKPNSAISNSLEFFGDDCRFEAELCLLIENSKIVGLGLGLDMTHAKIQNKMKEKGLPWERAKAFDGSAVLSDFVSFDEDISNISFELYINDTLTQHADYSLMMYKPDEIVDEVSNFMTLEDGDIIMTGTPKGVGYYTKGDTFTANLYNNDTLLLNVSWIAK